MLKLLSLNQFLLKTVWRNLVRWRKWKEKIRFDVLVVQKKLHIHSNSMSRSYLQSSSFNSNDLNLKTAKRLKFTKWLIFLSMDLTSNRFLQMKTSSMKHSMISMQWSIILETLTWGIMCLISRTKTSRVGSYMMMSQSLRLMTEKSRRSMLIYSCIEDEILILREILRRSFQSSVPISRGNLSTQFMDKATCYDIESIHVHMLLK